MAIILRPITVENWQECLALTVHPEQARFVSPNMKSLAEAYIYPELRPYGIYADATMVGFNLFGKFSGDDRYWIVRLMVDAAQQGKGYGRAAMNAIITRLAAEPGCDEISLDYKAENEVARRLYASLGFREVEVLLDGAIVASLDVTQRRAVTRADIPVLTFDPTTSADDHAFLHRQIQAFNASHSLPHRLVHTPEHAAQPLHLFVRDAEGAIWGGIAGSTYWDWLEIEYLWLDDRLRGQGYGEVLMARAEEEAVRRGATRVSLSTFSFQAREFYERLGYHVVGMLDDYPPDGAYYMLRKDLG